MKKRIAILRGINVGGKRKILMKDLKELFQAFGYDKVQTFIQSGNVIFKTANTKTNLEMAKEIEIAILQNFGFEVPVIVLSANELKIALSENPFLADKNKTIESLHLTFLKELPPSLKVKEIEQFACSPDQFKISNKTVFIYCAGKYHKSKLTNNFFENKLKVQATTRNWKTVLKLLDLAEN